MSIIEFSLAVLLVYRLSYAIAQEEGPFSIYSNLRDRVGQRNWIGRGLHCILCVSFNLSVLAPILLSVADWRMFVLYWLGTAGAILVLQRLLK